MRPPTFGTGLLVTLIAAAGVGGGVLIGAPSKAPPAEAEPPRATADSSSPVLRGRPQGRGFEVADAEVPRVAFTEELAEHDYHYVGWPPDPPQAGPRRLVLQFVDAQTQAPVRTDFELWQLDAPATTYWTAGDRIRADVCDVLSRHVVEGLPAGRYRVVAHVVAPGQADPPAFEIEIESDETEIRLDIVPPHSFRLRLLVYDESGVPLSRIQRDSGPCSGTHTRPVTPAWATPRHVRSSGEAISYESWCHWDGDVGAREVTTVDRENFLVDEGWVESSRHESSGASVRYGLPGRTAVRVSVCQMGTYDRLYLAVAVPLAWVRARIRLPSGLPLGETDDLVVDASCRAAKLGDAYPPSDAWRDVPIHVRVQQDGEDVGKGTLRLGEPDRLIHLSLHDE